MDNSSLVRAERYRPELDGLRGIAIALTLAAHLHLPYLEGGGVAGVTLFFVLSGYLITGLLREELARTGRIDLRAFYVRRVRRLLPALVALLVVVGVIEAGILGHGQAFASDAVVVLLYGASIADSFGQPMTFLGGTWSLSVEEMFYAIWPALFIIARGQRRLLVVLGVGIAASMLVRLSLEGGPLTWNRPDVRADAILWGCILAFVPLRLPRLAAATGWGIVALVTVLEPDSLKIGLTAAAVSGAVLVATARPGWLSWRPLVRLGQISYGLYLAQMLVVDLVAPEKGVIDPAKWIVAAAGSVLLALASERWIERRFRLRRGIPALSVERGEASKVSEEPRGDRLGRPGRDRVLTNP